MKVLFVAGFGPIVRDLEESARFVDVEDIEAAAITPWMREGEDTRER